LALADNCLALLNATLIEENGWMDVRITLRINLHFNWSVIQTGGEQ